MSFKIKFDYRFDESNFFTKERKAVLEYAGEIWSYYIQDNFKAIAKDEILGIWINNVWQEVTLNKSIDDLLIFVSTVRLDSGTLAEAGPGYSYSPDLEARIFGKDFEPWLGVIEFNSLYTNEFYFDSTPETNDVPFEEYDFLSLSLHEIGHILGIGTADSFVNQIENGKFVGSKSLELNNGQPIPLNLDQDHIEEDFNIDSYSDASLDPSLSNGERVFPTRLDLAILKDIGYEIADVAFEEPIVGEAIFEENSKFKIEFDFSLDESNFFTAEKKAILEYAGDIWSSYIQDEFTAVNSTTVNISSVDGSSKNITLDDSIDDLLIFVSSIDFNSSGTSGLGSRNFPTTFTYSSSLDLQQRFLGKDFEPWVGNIEFNAANLDEFYFDSTLETDDVPFNKYDFLTTSLHEIGRILGIGTAQSFDNQTENSRFQGAKSIEVNDGKAIDVNTLLDFQQPLGERELPSKLDLAILKDIGYEIADVVFEKTIVEIANEEIVTVEANEVPMTNQLSLSNVHRFYQHDRGFHFYTADANEITVVREKSQNRELPYNYEDAKFTVLSDNKNTLTGEIVEDVKPVYRFYNTSTGAHIYTMDEKEKGYIQENLSNYNFEGINYYAFESKPENMATLPVYRMLNSLTGTHLFSVDQNEINYIQENLPHFSVEGNDGIAFYVFEL